MAELNTATQQAQGFASELGIDLDPDLKGGLLVPQIVQVDPVTGSMRHINDGRGSDYYAARIDFKYGQAPVASRAVAVVMPGARTNLGYRPLGPIPKNYPFTVVTAILSLATHILKMMHFKPSIIQLTQP